MANLKPVGIPGGLPGLGGTVAGKVRPSTAVIPHPTIRDVTPVTQAASRNVQIMSGQAASRAAEISANTRAALAHELADAKKADRFRKALIATGGVTTLGVGALGINELIDVWANMPAEDRAVAAGTVASEGDALGDAIVEANNELAAQAIQSTTLGGTPIYQDDILVDDSAVGSFGSILNHDVAGWLNDASHTYGIVRQRFSHEFIEALDWVLTKCSVEERKVLEAMHRAR